MSQPLTRANADVGVILLIAGKRRARRMRGFRKASLLTAGTLCVILAVIGVLVPVLPTTPFLLLAAACYARSSRRFYDWLIANRWLGPYLRHYREGRGLPLAQKAVVILLLWLSIGYAVWFVVSPWWLRSVLLAVAVGVTIHLATIKTYRAPKEQRHRGRRAVEPDGSSPDRRVYGPGP